MNWWQEAKPKRTRKRRVNHEDNECSTFVDTLAWKRPHVFKMLTKVEPGGTRGKAEAARLKRLGSKKGFPDYFIFYPTERFHGLAIEMKRPDGSTANKAVVSPEQHEWIFSLREKGYAAYICYTAEEALEVVEKYLRT